METQQLNTKPLNRVFIRNLGSRVTSLELLGYIRGLGFWCPNAYVPLKYGTSHGCGYGYATILGTHEDLDGLPGPSGRPMHVLPALPKNPEKTS